jgi:thioester reductase-like protein
MRKTILLTGASGVVGQALAEKLATRHELVCLTHRTPVQEGVAQVSADLTQPYLGLDTRRYTDLARRVDAVVHSAAITHFGASAQATRDLNVHGTRRILEDPVGLSCDTPIDLPRVDHDGGHDLPAVGPSPSPLPAAESGSDVVAAAAVAAGAG